MKNKGVCASLSDNRIALVNGEGEDCWILPVLLELH